MADPTCDGRKGVCKVLFSDLDGTLVHFHHEIGEYATVEPITDGAAGGPTVLYKDLASGEQRPCYVLPSSTAGPAYVSARTHQLIHQLRAAGTLFVVVTAGRKSTLLSRIPQLPVADVYVGEAGGRILLNTQSPLLFPNAPSGISQGPPPETALVLDGEWAARLESVTGPLDSDTPPEKRRGPLWDLYRRLQAHGLAPDAKSYWACFRVDPAKGRCSRPEAEAVLHAICAVLPPSLTFTSNLGKVDFYPAGSGKGQAVEYLMRKFGLTPADSAAMFDDDNDLPMAHVVEHCYVVRMLTPSVRQAVEAHPEWRVAKKQGVLASEELLEHLLADLTTANP